MATAAICTIGDEILIGQILDTNSNVISQHLNDIGVRVTEMVSLPDESDSIKKGLDDLLSRNDIVISTGGLGPTKDDITKAVISDLSGSRTYVLHKGQEEMVHTILRSRGLDVLDINLNQAMVPDKCQVIVNKRGTAPILVTHFPKERYGHNAVLYCMPGVPHETVSALPDVLHDIRLHFKTESIIHRNIMVYGLAESALSKKIEVWEDALPDDMHLAYLPNTLTGVRLRLSLYGGLSEDNNERLDNCLNDLKDILGDYIYAETDSNLQTAIAKLLKGSGETLAVAESCTGGEISHLLTTVPGSSEYYKGSVTSYWAEIKSQLLGVSESKIDYYGIVSSNVAEAMAEGVKKLMGSTYSVATTGFADGDGDEREPGGTVWIAVSGPDGTKSIRFNYKNDRQRNIERFAASALNELRKLIEDTRKSK